MNQRTYPQGVPCWIDTEQPDVNAAADFYGGLFGWTFEDVMPPGEPGRYLIAKLDGRDVAGIASSAEGTAWNTYIAVDDADAAVRRLVTAGAKVLAPPADAGEGGRGALLADPEGVKFRIWQPKRRLGAQAVNQPGAWNFSDLHTADPSGGIAFYEDAFGWQVDDVGFGLMVRRPGYGDHLEATIYPDIRTQHAEIAAPPGFDDAIAWVVATDAGEPPHWHVTFAVADRDQAVADAIRLGAEILRQYDTGWTREALIRDPQGATFSASEFTPPTE
ncbi:VOC family protein [Pseudarthrobacter sp. R1]|uniref:VOC family protein n=1 Tax=Pseudarthrobacter sp. R1 TaxID=2944934 RepID=UPI00210A0827|nr:VOC family protein [Pseudarthrobacter sp. R1]MCQ6271215.1 VOC family protein [Pseudarthrobacter sp. R1]